MGLEKLIEKERKNKSINVLDDDRVLLNLQCRFLRIKGYDVESSNCMKDAIEHLKDRDYDLVISDGILGDGTAKDVYSWLKQNKPYQKLMVVSGTSEICNHFENENIPNMPKPIDCDKYLEMVSKLTGY